MSDEVKKNAQASVLAPYLAGPVARSIGGAIGGVMEAMCLQPIDTVKTRLQLDKVGKYTSIPGTFRTIAEEEGVRALWKGLTPFATHLFFKYALRFGSNAFFESLLRKEDGTLPHTSRALAGLGAGITEALVIVTPFEVVKISLQKQIGMSKENLKYKGPIHCAATIVRAEGPLGLWKGATPTMFRNGTNQMSLFYTKPLIDGLVWDKHDGDGKDLLVWQSLVSGLLAGSMGPIASGPFDLIKTRLMAQEKSGTIKYKGLLDALVKIPREEGFFAMWRGLLPRLMRIPPGQAIVWMVRDQVVQYIEKDR
ncbi:hypothetical protein BSKO_06658 [Bryopsis sp. KO-2023]|nr:hypothetical protein BSKO_06658 [Bryopsis sp. KO-2023]